MAVPLVNQQIAVGQVCLAALGQFAGIRAQPHRAAHLGDVVLLVQETDDRMPAVAFDLGGVCILKPDDVAAELDESTLQPETDAKEGHSALPGEADRLDLARNPTVAESARHQHAIDTTEDALGPLALDFLGLDAANEDPTGLSDAGVVEGLVDRLVRVLV